MRLSAGRDVNNTTVRPNKSDAALSYALETDVAVSVTADARFAGTEAVPAFEKRPSPIPSMRAAARPNEYTRHDGVRASRRTPANASRSTG